ncbi:MAG: hypothetical protein H6661_08155 [Ardenticatenaceae bacterium]|nr:hypothetical protein [Ardenticatenaceae bacterium]
MRTAGKIFLFLGLLLLVVIAVFFIFRRPAQAEFGPAIAICPGPDQFGYTCTTADGYAYIDATQDTGLYEDDGMVSLDLPFPFTFMAPRTRPCRPAATATCSSPAATHSTTTTALAGPCGHGRLIAPFWDDLDLSAAGFLETEVTGTTPNRVFVVEWDDVPRYGEGGDNNVTFAVQLFETTNDVVFLYEDVNTLAESNGRSATIGLQSEAAGLALQFSCNQPAVNDHSGLLFPYPALPNADVGRETTLYHPQTAGPLAKGETLTLLETLNQRGPAALTQLQRHWLNQTPQRQSEWVQVDLDGDGSLELVLVWRGPVGQPQASELVVLTPPRPRADESLLDQRGPPRRSNAAVNLRPDVRRHRRRDRRHLAERCGQRLPVRSNHGARRPGTAALTRPLPGQPARPGTPRPALPPNHPRRLCHSRPVGRCVEWTRIHQPR